jgi:3-phosphoshikimate 1-carboxyvinyltransferase
MTTLDPPRSKSDAQRALVLAALLAPTRGASEVDLGAGPWPSDVEVLRGGLRALAQPDVDLDCRDGGAPFRFLLTQAALSWGRTVRFNGSPRLGARPHGPLLQALRQALGPQGLEVVEGSPWPLVLRAPRSPATVERFEVTGAESSQFASSLVLGAARQVAERGARCTVRSHGPMTSMGYLDLTCRWVERAGFILKRSPDAVTVEALRPGVALPEVPGDWSSLTYLLPIAWKRGALVSSVQRGTGHPDEAFAGHLEGVGLALEGISTEVEGRAPAGDRRRHVVAVRGVPRGGLQVDAEACPDSVPALVALATVLPAPSTVERVGILRHKESDRVDGVMELATRVGARCTLQGETLTVTPGTPPTAFDFDAREDHRLAMAAATASILTGAALALVGAASVKKSFPGFWDELAKVGWSLPR